MYKFSIKKDLFVSILSKEINILEKEDSNFWKNELFIPKIKDNKLFYEIKQFKKIILTNGLGDTKPKLVMECLEVKYCKNQNKFEFHLGKIIEQKNITIQEEVKDKMTEQLLQEDKQSKEKVKMVQQKIIF